MNGVSAEQSSRSSRTSVQDRVCQLPTVEGTRLYYFPGRTQSSTTVPFHPPPPPPSVDRPMASNAAVGLVLSPSSLFRSASAPPDYVPPIPPSRQQRTVRRSEFRTFPVPPEVVETRRREKECCACCLKCIKVLTTLRWLFVSISLLGAACVIAGIVFGVMSSTLDRNTFFVLAFTFIGLGIVLVIVVGIGWRCAPAGHEPCHVLCHLSRRSSSSDGGFGHYESATIRGAPRLMQGRRNQWYGGFLYPEFRYGTPPPSYTASMQQYRNQILSHLQPDGATVTDSSVIGTSILSLDNLSNLPSSPPPTYQSRTVGRSRPSLGPIVNLPRSPDGQPVPLPPPPPPPYTNDSRASSVNGLDVTNDVGSGTCDVALVSTSSDSDDHNFHEAVQTVLESRDEAAYSEDVPSNAEISKDRPEVGQPSVSSLPLADETVPSVRSMIQHYEILSRLLRTPAALGTAESNEETGTAHQDRSAGGIECNGNSSASIVLPVNRVLNSRLRNDQPQHHPRTTTTNADDFDSPPAAVASHDISPINSNAAGQSREPTETILIQFIQPSRNKSKTATQSYRSPNQSYKDFNRSQSLEDHDIGESGI